MDWNARYSGGNRPGWEIDRASPVVLRLLSAVHHPPARVLVPGAGEGHEARALHARGYRVTVTDAEVPGLDAAPGDFLTSDHAGAYDLLCERGRYASLAPAERDAYVAAAGRALRSGGKLFGVFVESGAGAPGTTASDLIHRFSAAFEVERMEASAFAAPEGFGWLEVVLVRR